jgi:hypothetical protein
MKYVQAVVMGAITFVCMRYLGDASRDISLGVCYIVMTLYHLKD